MKCKKIIASVILILVFLCVTNISHASIFDEDPFATKEKTDVEKAIDNENAGLFESIVAKMIGGLAETVMDLTTKEEFGVGFKQYDELIFGNSMNDIAPFGIFTWMRIMEWYWRISSIIGVPILIAVIVLAYKVIFGGISVEKRQEAKDNLMRLFFGAVSIVFAPVFVKFLLFVNNYMVKALVGTSEGGLDNLLGNSFLTSVSTGNAIATAIVIALFAYLFVNVNIRFIVRQFIIIVFTIFTPIVAVFWILNKRAMASSIWFRSNYCKYIYAICLCISIFGIFNIFA